MRAQLIQYVDLLFAGTKDCEDIHQEILQNTLDRYDDLILEGKTPEAAYRLAILSIGDINEIIGGSSSAPSFSTPKTSASTIADKKSTGHGKKKWIPILIAIFVAVILLNLVGELLDDRVWRGHSSPVATHIPERIEPTEAHVYLDSTFYAEKAWNVRSKPSPTAEVLGMIEAGDTVHLIQDDVINGQHWGFIEEPVQGWICLDAAVPDEAASTIDPTIDPTTDPTVAADPTTDPTVTADSNVTIPSAGNNVVGRGYGCNASDVSDISIEWAAGNIRIIPVDGSRINVTETGDFEKHPMTIKNRNGKLSIEYCDKKAALGLKTTKDLTIEIPRDFFLQELDIDAASATVLVEGLNARSVEFEGASGICNFQDCQIDSLDVDTASGDVQFTGTLNTLECSAASASFVGTLSNVPNRMEMESMSGNLDVTLPENAGFTVRMEGMSRNFTSDFPITCDGNHHSQNHVHSSCDAKTHVHGDGTCRIHMEAMSGEVFIRKG